MTVVNPYGDNRPVDYSDEAAASRRGQRNADYNAQKLRALTQGR